MMVPDTQTPQLTPSSLWDGLALQMIGFSARIRARIISDQYPDAPASSVLRFLLPQGFETPERNL